MKDGRDPLDKDEIVSTLIEQSDPEWAPPPEAVVTLTNDDFDEVVNQGWFRIIKIVITIITFVFNFSFEFLLKTIIKFKFLT